MEDRIISLEEQIAHLERTLEEISDIIVRQQRDLARLTHRLDLLMEREASREIDPGAAIPLADQRPPHW